MMNHEKQAPESRPWLDRSPKSVLEQALIEEYLESKGHRFVDLHDLPPDDSRRLMDAACRYAKNRLDELKSQAGARQKSVD